MADSASGRSARGYRGEVRSSGFGVVMTVNQLTALFQGVKRNSYVTMCQTLERRSVVDMVDQRVARMF